MVAIDTNLRAFHPDPCAACRFVYIPTTKCAFIFRECDLKLGCGGMEIMGTWGHGDMGTWGHGDMIFQNCEKALVLL